MSAASAISLAVVVVACIAAGLYGCTEANRSYYAAQSECISGGGSWVAAQLYQAHCIAGRKP